MKYLVDITPRQVELIKKLLNKGSYETFTQFVSAAIENQIALEGNEARDFIPFVTDTENHQISSLKTIVSTGGIEKYKIVNIPAFEHVVNTPQYKDLVFSSQKLPEDKAWIWGQVNKIFPVKLGLRILHQLLTSGQPVELNEFLSIAANEAATVGDKIREHEQRNNKMRDEKISAALPSGDEKSQNRYKFQFMVYPRKDGLLDGAMALMRFCNVYTEKKKQFIGITESGLNFSLLNNSVLDNNDFDLSLTKEESLFYISHIKENVKGEYTAMRWMLEKINGGKNTRELLNGEIEKAFGKTWSATDAVINTQRAGITARMFELGLIEKEKNGIYVEYAVSEIGAMLFLK